MRDRRASPPAIAFVSATERDRNFNTP